MRLRRLRVATLSTVKDLLRRRIVLLMLLLVPTVFYAVVLVITTTRSIDFQLSAIEAEDYLWVAERDEALVFVGLAAVGVLSGFIALSLAQRDLEVARRLLVCGYRPWELVAARLGVLLAMIALVAFYATAMLPIFFTPRRILATALGFGLCGWVYACYGLLVGALFRQELEGVLFVALLANLDVGWLQNPIYYRHAQHQLVIRSLPGYLPSQVAMAAAFSEHTLAELLPAIGGSALYALVLLALATLAYARRVRTRRVS